MTTDYNPFDPEQVDDHFGVLAQLRAERPVAEVMPGVFYVSRRSDIVAISRDHATWPQGGFEPLAEDNRPLDARELGETDPPFHTVVRRNLQTFFGPRRIAAYEPLVARACDRLLDEVLDALSYEATVDLIDTFAAPLPAEVIGRLSGIPEDDLERVRAYSDDFIFARVHAGSEEAADAAARCQEFDGHLREVIAERRSARGTVSNPGGPGAPEDLLAALLDCRDAEGQPISDERILTHLSKDVLIGGVETTTHFVGNLIFQVLSRPGLYERLGRDRGLVGPAVEESLRHMAPVQVVFRRAAADAEVGGVSVPAGSVAVLGLVSGSRDEEVWEDPDVFDIERGEIARRHLAFNGGIHLCVGAPLARLEAAVALETLLDRLPRLELAPGTSYERVRFFMMRGPARLEVTRP